LNPGLPFLNIGINLKFYQQPKKFKRMIKVLGIFAAAAIFAACNSGSSDAAKAADSTVTAVADTAKAAIDSTVAKVDSTAKAAVDSVKAVADTAKKNVKATEKKAKEAVKK
jgi:hypothetical protein